MKAYAYAETCISTGRERYKISQPTITVIRFGKVLYIITAQAQLHSLTNQGFHGLSRAHCIAGGLGNGTFGLAEISSYL